MSYDVPAPSGYMIVTTGAASTCIYDFSSTQA
jgi:hypothetical protein